MRRVFIAAAFAAVCSRAGLAGQGVPSRPSPIVPVEHTVRIDAIVVDARGNPITDLKATDFEVQEDGRPVTLDDVRTVRIVNEPAGAADAAVPVSSAETEEQEARQPSTRLVAIYLDEYHIGPGDNTERARQALTTFIDRQIGPRDLIVVMKPLESIFTIRMTHDSQEA